MIIAKECKRSSSILRLFYTSIFSGVLAIGLVVADGADAKPKRPGEVTAPPLPAVTTTVAPGKINLDEQKLSRTERERVAKRYGVSSSDGKPERKLSKQQERILKDAKKENKRGRIAK